MSEKRLLTTLTGEIFQPARVYYDLVDQETLKEIFSKMNFMDFDPTHDRWVWLFAGKAKALKFKNRYRDIPKKYHPIILGSFYTANQGEMFLEVRSFERATQGISFFDGKIPKSVANVTDITVINKLFDVGVDMSSPLDHLFGPNETKIDPDALIEELIEAKERGGVTGVPNAGLDKIFQIVEEKTKQPLPEIERFPTHYYEDGIESLEASLNMRQRVAFEQWRGNTEFSMHTLVEQLAKRMPWS